MESKGEININLLNFEDPQFEDSKYILTSPRSLEACSRLNIKPVEILTRRLEDFRDELLPRGLSVRSVFEIYNEYEKERRNKLQLCIEERRLVTSEYMSGNDTQSDEDFQNIGAREQFNANLLRSRPTGTNSLRQNRQSQDEINDRAEEKQKGWSTDPGKKLKSRSKNKSSQNKIEFSSRQATINVKEFGARLDNITQRAVKKLNKFSEESTDTNTKPIKKKLGLRFTRSQSDLGYGSGRDTFSDTGSMASSILSARSCLTDVTFVTDPLLRKKFRSSLNSQTRLRTKDRKILSVMLQKKELDKEERKKREKLHNQWEEERTREQEERDTQENQRRLILAKERNRINEIKMETEARRLQAEKEERTEREQQLKHNDQMSSESCRRQHLTKLLKLKEKQVQEMEKKKSVDSRVEQQRKESEDYQILVKAKQEAELRRAMSLKLTKEQEMAMRTRMKNKQAKEKHEEKMTAIQRQSVDDLALLRKSLEFRDHSVKNHLSRQRWHKELKIREHQQELERKIEQSRKNQQEMEEEIRMWHDQLRNYHCVQERRAAETAKQTLSKKSQKVHAERSQKEKLHREKMKQILEQEEQWKVEMEAAVAMKQLRIQGVLEERDKMIQESRSLAGTSERLRSQLKQHYSTTDLDDLNRKAQLENKILFRPHSKTSVQFKSDNVSRLLFG